MDTFLRPSPQSPQSPMSPQSCRSDSPLTFQRKLGVVSFLQNEILYKARIADSMDISDDFHQRRFNDVTDWIDFIQSKYPSQKQQPKQNSKTMHEYFKSTNLPRDQHVDNESVDDDVDVEDEDSIDHFDVKELVKSILRPIALNRMWRDRLFEINEGNDQVSI